MSDFSELCPLFNTGVYSELTICEMGFSGISTTMNALGGQRTRAAAPGSFKFGRTVIVNKVWAQKIVNPSTTSTPILVVNRMATSGTAAMTAFASIKFSATQSLYCLYRAKKMTQASNKTFLAADVLGFSVKTKKTRGGVFSFIVQYKEK